MVVSIEVLAKNITPENTILLFGAGASIPSGAPSVAAIMSDLAEKMDTPPDGYSFAEYCSLFELTKNRRDLVDVVRSRIKNLRPNGGLTNLPNYNWRSIYTTNYDDLIEKAYIKKDKPIKIYSSNFDFGNPAPPDATKIFKIHGTIGLDVVDGSNSRMILTVSDNEAVEDYRESIYDHLKGDLAFCDLVIIGHSLSDPDIRSLVQRAAKIKKDVKAATRIHVLVYSQDESRALLIEQLGVTVAFGGIDDFFLGIEIASPSTPAALSEDYLDRYPRLAPTTTDIKHESSTGRPNFDAMYSGAAASYSEIRAGYTFERTLRSSQKAKILSGQKFLTILGASGVGKTTLARQIALSLVEGGYLGWEHHNMRPFFAETWRTLAAELKAKGERAVLVLDDAHNYLPAVNELVNLLVSDANDSLVLIITSSNNHWKPRVKSANLTRYGEVVRVSVLDAVEIGSLLNLVENQPMIARLVDKSFKGFNSTERKRRLVERCNSDFFVCLKNIFANERFDLIVLREFAAIASDFQAIYKNICALESLGVVVHRQLIIRLLDLPVQDLGVILDNLEGLVDEYTLNKREGIFGWKGRHPVISKIVSDYKFSDPDDILDLIRRVVKQLSPVYEVEISTLRQLCSSDSGVRRILSVSDQNEILRMMISRAPGERVPRHRLISNLIRQGAFVDAETEIRVFENDLGSDGPVKRYKVRLLLERAIASADLPPEDRGKILADAYNAAVRLLEQNPQLPHNLRLFSDVCLEMYKVSGDYGFVDSVRTAMKNAEAESSDPEVTQALLIFEHRLNRSVETIAENAIVFEDLEDASETT